jgi:multiple sugar transport system ATP-binding protein
VLQQVGSPTDVYTYPANTFVAQFVGSPVMNILDASVSDAGGNVRVLVEGATDGFAFPPELTQKLDAGRAKSSDLTMGVRPEAISVAREGIDGYLPVETRIIEPLGSHDIVDLKVGSQMLRARTKSGFVGNVGDKVWIRIDPAQTHFFDKASGNSLGVRL